MIICFLFIQFALEVLGTLEILEVKGPSAVQNGTLNRVVLDCIFSGEERDLKGLVVKWYFNHYPYPVYQWIPGMKPQAFGILQDRLDLNYTVSNEDWAKHRALTILSPTSELSGKYSCSISSFAAEDLRIKHLIIYVPPKKAALTYKKPSLSSLMVTCDAQGIYPEPQIFVYRSSPFLDRSHRSIITGSVISKNVIEDKKIFNVTTNVVLFDFELRGKTLFACEISIPGTNYNMKKELLYNPEYSGSNALWTCTINILRITFTTCLLFL